MKSELQSKIILTLAAFAAFTFSHNLNAADTTATNSAPVLRQLNMKVEKSRIKNLGDSQTIIVPTVYLKLPVAGKVMAVKQTSAFSLIGNSGGGNTVRASAHYSVTGLDKQFAQHLAQKVYDDLVAKLRAAGYTVKTYADIKDLDGVKSITRDKPDDTWGMPMEKDRSGNQVFVVATPTDEQNFKPGLGGAVISPFQHFGKSALGESSGTLLIPVLVFDAPQAWGKTDSGYSRISAEANVAPGMNLQSATASLLTAHGGWGGVQTKGPSPNISTKVGELAKQDATDKAGNAFSKSLSFLTGSGSITGSKGIYTLAIDQTAYEAGLMNGAGAFNTEVATAAKEVHP